MNGDNPEQLAELIQSLLTRSKVTNHRRCLVLAGEQQWTRTTCQQILNLCNTSSVHWIAKTAPEHAATLDPNKIQNILGCETDVIIYDAFDGFQPDAFGAVAGIIRGGGLLILLTPELDRWHELQTKGHDQSSSRFIKRISNIIQTHASIVRIEQGKPLPENISSIGDVSSTKTVSNSDFDDALYKTSDQKLAVAAIKKVVTGHRRRPLVLTADRGRGKTTALGIAAAQLMQASVDHVIVSAPRASSVDILFQHASALLQDPQISKNQITTPHATLEFISPDELVRNKYKTKLLIVDEAAAIPAPLLTQLLKNYSRIVFATTIHGYEGTGRGFALRFKQSLDSLTPNWKQLQINQAIRWAENDPLEDFCFKALLLNANQTEAPDQKTTSLSDLSFEQIDRDTLIKNEDYLHQLFGLLVNAHYQTKPSDLKDLLDGENLSLFVLQKDKHIFATALIAKEGGFSETLSEEIYQGKRRPHGHLIPELLSVHLGQSSAAMQVGARIVRIAVQPNKQQQGIGRLLLQSLARHFTASKFDYIATSFGATVNLLNFWHGANYQTIRIGFQRNACSGEHSAVLLQSLTPIGEEILTGASSQFQRQFPEQLCDSLKDLEPEVVAEILQKSRLNLPFVLDAIDLENMSAFVHQHRIYEASPASFKRIVLNYFQQPAILSLLCSDQRNLLIKKVLQHHSWEALSSTGRFTGKKEILTALKTSIKTLLDNHS